MASDAWREATEVPLKGGVSPQSNKAFGKGMDEVESTNAKLSHATAKVSGPDHAAKGSNDISHAGTMTPLESGKVVTANRPTAWPRGFQK